MGNTATEKNEQENVAYHLNMLQGLFTVGAIDNIDENPTSITAMLFLYGTAAWLHQKVIDPSEFQSRERPVLSTEKFPKDLPLDYTKIQSLHLPSTTPQPDFPDAQI